MPQNDTFAEATSLSQEQCDNYFFIFFFFSAKCVFYSLTYSSCSYYFSHLMLIELFSIDIKIVFFMHAPKCVVSERHIC